MSKTRTPEEAQTLVNELHSQGKDLLEIPASELNAKIAKQYEDYTEIAEDLMIAGNALLTALKLPSEMVVLRQSLQVNAVMSYIRCFNDSDGRNAKIAETPQWIGSGEKIHNTLKNSRNNLFAHAGVTPHRGCVANMMFGVEFNGKPEANSLPADTPIGITIHQKGFGQFEDHQMEEIVQHIETVLNKVDDQRDKIRDRLVQLASETFLKKT